MSVLGWIVTAMAVVAVLVGFYLVHSWDDRQRRARAQRHREAGGRAGEEPDAMPRHGGGSGFGF